MQVVILNKRDGHKHDPSKGIFEIDRNSPLGNPFTMKDQSEEERNKVCDQYIPYFERILELVGIDPNGTDYLMKIKEYLILNGKVSLLCWCHPFRCHSWTIRDWLLDFNR